MDWVGVDSHVTLDDEGAAIARNLIGAARTIAMAWSDRDGDVPGRDGTADNVPRGGAYDCKYVCRAAGSSYFMDICARHLVAYTSFQVGRCPFADSSTSRR